MGSPTACAEFQAHSHNIQVRKRLETRKPKLETEAMILLRPSDERGRTQLDWLDSRHTFSFGDYFDARWPGFRGLRVINDDRIGAGAGFGMHPHRDMEIVTYMLDGALEHKDSMGNGSVIRSGDVQAMSAGSGITHREYNSSKTEPVHLLQIWIMPRQRGVTPSYAQSSFRASQKPGQWILVASGDGRDSSLKIHHNADLFAIVLEPGQKLSFELRPRHHAWIQVARGSISLNGRDLQEGDGAGVSDEKDLEVAAREKAEVLMFDLE